MPVGVGHGRPWLPCAYRTCAILNATGLLGFEADLPYDLEVGLPPVILTTAPMFCFWEHTTWNYCRILFVFWQQ